MNPARCLAPQIKALRETGLDDATVLQELAWRLFLRMRQEEPEIPALDAEALNRLDPAQQAGLAAAIEGLNWPAVRDKGGSALFFERFLEAYLPRSGLDGLFFPPPALVDAVVALLQPQPEESVFDPCAGAGGFLVAADAYLQAVLADETQAARSGLLLGLERDPLPRRLGHIALALHCIEPACLRTLDALTPAADALPAVEVICGNLAGPLPAGKGEEWAVDTARQASLLRYCLAHLKPGGRAALVVSDELLYRDSEKQLRGELLGQCRLHTLVRLPGGLFHGRTVSANLLCFTRGDPTETLWVYDMRTGLPWFGPAPFTYHYLAPLQSAYGEDPLGLLPRSDSGEQGRFRPFARAQLAEEEDNLDIFWLDEDACPAPPAGGAGLSDAVREWMGEELCALERMLRED